MKTKKCLCELIIYRYCCANQDYEPLIVKPAMTKLRTFAGGATDE